MDETQDQIIAKQVRNGIAQMNTALRHINMTPEERVAWDRLMASWASLIVTAEKLTQAFTELAPEFARLHETCKRAGLFEQPDP